MNEANFANNNENVFDPHYPNNYSNVSIIKQGYAQKNPDFALQQRYPQPAVE